jgi:hypothetical protein
MSFNFLNDGRGEDQKVSPIDTFIDPVSKIRVSQPSNLIDTDFEYGLQPTKWETVELINNTPAFFSKGGDTSISDITGITTNAGTREITVTTAFPHNLDVGIPIRVSGTKSVTADGSYIINATPSTTSFTYLARDSQPETLSIFDLYSSIITGEFFQGSQISVDASEGITTFTDENSSNSTLTVKTENSHGFGPNTPFYFLNLNSTIAQEFQSQNSSAVSFDPTNSSTAQTFDGSNTLIQLPIDLSNSATTSTFNNSIQSTDPTANTFTITIAAGDGNNWSALKNGDPLYYDVTAGVGYFQSNPRGVVFIKDVEGINSANNLATFQVSEIPDGSPISVTANIIGFFRIANNARTFAGNNVNPETQKDITIIREEALVFDGANEQGIVAGVQGYSGTSINLLVAGEIEYYPGAMLLYTTTGTPPSELSNNTTYFVTSFTEGAQAGLYTMSIANLPGQAPINFGTTGSGTQQFRQIGISLDKDIVHVKDANFDALSLIEYSFPESGSFDYDTDNKKRFFFVKTVYDEHNFGLGLEPTSFISATGGTVITTETFEGQEYTVHSFNLAGGASLQRTTNQTFTFQIDDIGTFNQTLRVSIRNGSFDGITQEESTITPERRSYTVVLTPVANQISRVSIAYPKTEVPNVIPFAQFSPLPIAATGGSIGFTTVNNIQYQVHTFSVGTTNFVVSSLGNLGGNTAEYLVVAGGGGGGVGDSSGGGGGGGGGYRTGTSTLSVGTFPIVVGDRGTAGNSGANSSALGITSNGGGRGGNFRGAGVSGGSGGGAGWNSGASGGAGTTGQGNRGGNSPVPPGGQWNGSGGGGGAGGVGSNGFSDNSGGPGAGVANSITGTSVTYSRGGSGNATSADGPGWGGGNRQPGAAGRVVIRYPIG